MNSIDNRLRPMTIEQKDEGMSIERILGPKPKIPSSWVGAMCIMFVAYLSCPRREHGIGHGA